MVTVATPTYGPPCDSCGELHVTGLRTFICPRCTHEHSELGFTLAGPPIASNTEEPYRYFAVCPVTRQPILFRNFTSAEMAMKGEYDG